MKPIESYIDNTLLKPDATPEQIRKICAEWSDAYIYRGLLRFYSRARTTGNVNLRTGPGTSYSKVGVVTNGTAVTLLATDGSFCRVDTGYAIAYLSKKYLNY